MGDNAMRRHFGNEYDEPYTDDPEIDKEARLASSELFATIATVPPAMAIGGLNALYAGSNVPEEGKTKVDRFNLDAAIAAMHKAEAALIYQPKSEAAQEILTDVGGVVEDIGEKLLPAREAYERTMNPILGEKLAGGLYALGAAGLALAPTAPFRMAARSVRRTIRSAENEWLEGVLRGADGAQTNAPPARVSQLALADQRPPPGITGPADGMPPSGPGNTPLSSAVLADRELNALRETLGLASKRDLNIGRAAMDVEAGKPIRPADPNFVDRTTGTTPPTDAEVAAMMDQPVGSGRRKPLGQIMTGERGAVMFHGTPYSRMEKIPKGKKTENILDIFHPDNAYTGEGVQAYGYTPVAYLAESKGVAGSYQSDLATNRIEIPDVDDFVKKDLARDFSQSDFDSIDEIPDDWWEFQAKQLADEGYPEEAARLRAADKSKAKFEKGHLLEVDIPDEVTARMLDWDRPVGKDMEAMLDKEGLGGFIFSNSKGENLYRFLENKMGDQRASEWLKERGIPGIKYYDGNSRAAANSGTFVVTTPDGNKLLSTSKEKSLQRMKDNPGSTLSRPDEGTRNIVPFSPDDITSVKRDGDVIFEKAAKPTAVAMTLNVPDTFSQDTKSLVRSLERRQDLDLYDPVDLMSDVEDRMYDLEENIGTKSAKAEADWLRENVYRDLEAAGELYRYKPETPALAEGMQPIANRVEAEKRWGNGEDIYALHEMDDEPLLITSREMMNSYTPDQLVSAGMPAEKYYSGPAYRVEPGFEGGAPHGATAQDVIVEEMERKSLTRIEELGIDEKTYDSLENLPADQLVWVGRSKAELIEAYGPQDQGGGNTYQGLFGGDEADISDVSDLVAGGRIIFEDGDGALVLKRGNVAPVKVENKTEQMEWDEWFADSKVTDVVYHGTQSEIDTFVPGTEGTYGAGIYFSKDVETANFWADPAFAEGDVDVPTGPAQVYPVYVSIKNPASGELASAIEAEVAVSGGSTIKELKAKGYDGIVADDEVVAFDSEQVRAVFSKPVTQKEVMPEDDPWFKGSVVTNDQGHPLKVYRGEHGKPGNAMLQGRDPTIAFAADIQTANTYAQFPNNLKDKVVAPRVTPAYLSIKKPFETDPGDPFIDFDEIRTAIGEEAAIELAKIREVEGAVLGTDAFEEYRKGFDTREVDPVTGEETFPLEAFDDLSLAEILKEYPDDWAQFYGDGYVMLRDQAFVDALKAKGYDGVILGGSGENAGETEFHIFDESQAKSSINWGRQRGSLGENKGSKEVKKGAANVAVASYKNTPGARELAHAVRSGDKKAIAKMAADMAPMVPIDAVLIPIPSRSGVATTAKLLADEISSITGFPVADILVGNERESLYELKKAGGDPSDVELGFRVNGEVPSGNPVLIDSVIGTGTTMDAAMDAIPGATSLVHSIDTPPVSSEHKMDVARAARKTKEVTRLSAADSKVVKDSVPASRRKVVSASIRNSMSNYPKDDGWFGPLEVQKITEGTNRQGEIVYSVDYKPMSYTFARDDFGNPLKEEPNDQEWFDDGYPRERRVNELSEGMVDEVREWQRLAAAGDKTAQVVIRQSEWYAGMVRELRETYGGFGDLFADLLGALSPVTDVETNWKSAVQVLDRFTKGEFRPEVKAFVEFLDGGGTVGNYDGPVPMKLNDTRFGANSRNLLLALADLWRIISPNTAPKARNFSGNLIGLLNDATIDVWAARTLQRLAGHRRLPPLAEKAVQGNWNASATAITGDFALGQEVYARAAVELGMMPDSLQAMMWFGEKAIWTRNNWTTLAGEGGSFEQEAAKMPLSRGFVGASMDRPGAPQTPGNAGPVGDAIWQRLAADDEVRAVRVEQTVGMYMDSVEPSFDIEVVATENYSWGKLLEETAVLAKTYDQESAFVSRVVTKGSTPSENIRPGLEVYFAKKTDLDGAKALIGTLRDMDVDGFTVIQDIRGGVLGVRYQYVPEFDVMYGGKSIQDVPALIQSQMERLDDLIEEISQLDNVSHAQSMAYDTVVMTGNNYDNFIGTSADKSGQGVQKVWPKLSLGESIQSATAVAGQKGRSQLSSDNALLGETQ